MRDFRKDPRFSGIEPFQHKIWLSSPTMHGQELEYVTEAIETNWVSTIGENINEVERMTAAYVGRDYAVALSSGTAALHLAVKLCGEALYGRPLPGHGVLEGRKVFCSDLTFGATVNPVAYEGGEAVFIDSEYDTWNMDPAALERAFRIYPEVRLVVVAHLYGTPAKIGEIRAIADRHHALIVEDAAESFGARHQGIQTGCFGDVSIVSWNGNKLITGSSGGMLLTDEALWAAKARKWSTQSREDASWYQHEELGYNYRMSNIIAGVVRGQFPYIEEHIRQKQAVYKRYQKGLAGLPVRMNPMPYNSEPNCWLSCMMIDEEAMCRSMQSEREALYISEPGKSCPMEILEVLTALNAEGRPIWKPMHLQPIYRSNAFITQERNGRADSSAYFNGAGKSAGGTGTDVGADIFRRGVCLPSDNKITVYEQERIIEAVRRCFG